MADAPKILGTDTLRDAYPKLNSAIDNSNEAKTKADGADVKADEAISTANTAKTAADTVQSQFDQVVAEAGENNPEVVQARGEAVNLNARLNATDVRLAENAKKIPNITNASSKLKILNPYGNFQNIHPKVLHFPDGLFGYKWWMAYTPYPGGNTKQENPCIAVSNNGIDWELPSGMSSALLEDWNGITNSFNNDTHLIYRTDLDRLEVWFRVSYDDPYEAEVRRKTSLDGINWTATEVLYRGSRTGDDHICPTIVFEDNKYKMLSVNTVDGDRVLSYVESTDALNWSSRVETIVDWGTLTPWHMDFINVGGKYEMVMQAWDVGESNNTSSLYYMESSDLITWTKPTKILSPSALPNAFDNAGIYRSSIVKVDKTYYLFYSALNNTNQRAMALAYGGNILALKGFSVDIENLSQISINNGSLAVNLEQHPTTNNVLAIKQSSNNARHGGIKLGGLQFANGLVEGVTPEPGQIRYSASQDKHERYDGTKLSWVDLVPPSEKLLVAEKNAEQSLVNNSTVIINFESIIFNSGAFINNNTVKMPTGANYRFDVGLQLTGLSQGDAVEVYLMRNGSSKLRTLTRQSVTPDSTGQYFMNASGVLNLLANYEMSIGVIYKGSSSAKVSGYATQNYLFVERL
jgi:predicted GH43/DUF377 family glycosyl hydrolase